jgi:imidazolonepropionase-like amidohydrolase
VRLPGLRQAWRVRRARVGAACAAALLACLPLALPAARGGRGRPADGKLPVERVKFHLFKYQGYVGEEISEASVAEAGLQFKSKLRLSYLGGEVALDSALLAQPDLTPLRFEARGDTSTQSRVECTVEVSGGAAAVREGNRAWQAEAPARFFTAVGYAPVSAREMMVRYWLARGGQGRLALLPRGEVVIERRGTDTFEVGGKRVDLARYSIGGLIWGRETAWFDAAHRLVALVTVDAEFDRFEAVRDGYQSALPQFVAKSAQETITAFARGLRGVKPLREGVFALSGGALIDGRGGPSLKDATVIVAGSRIVAVGPRSEIKIPVGAGYIDARGKTILPGLWDMHTHYTQVEMGPAYLAAGVTAARDCGNDMDFILPVRGAINKGRLLGPRLLLAGYVDGEGKDGLGSVRAGTPDAARAVVRRYREAGFEQIKIYGNALMRADVVRAITDEAHRLKMAVTGHVPRELSAVQAVELGYDQINHIGFLLPLFRAKNVKPEPGRLPPLDFDSAEARRALQLFKEKGVVIEPTLARFELNTHPVGTPFIFLEPGAGKAPRELAEIYNGTGVDPERAKRALAVAEQAAAVLVALHRAGVPVVAGIDLAVPGHSLHRELELYVKAGMSPMEAIRSATSVAARAMGMEYEAGTIEVGKRADLIIVDGDPLASISDLRKVESVVTNGRLYDSARLWRSVGFRP